MRQPVVLSVIAAVALSACQPAPPTKPASQAMSSDTKHGAVTSLTYPVAKTMAQTDDYHGVKVADPYRWMEDLDSPATRDWIEAENKVTSAYLDGIAGRDKIRKPSHRNMELRALRARRNSTAATISTRTTTACRTRP